MSALLFMHDAEFAPHSDDWLRSEDLVQFTVEKIVTFKCRVPVEPGGDGATTTPLAARTERCGHLTNLLIGLLPTCWHHVEQAVPMMSLTPTAVLAALKKSGDGTPLRCADALSGVSETHRTTEGK